MRVKAVALDGTLFQKSGIISGGASELKAKARKWDEKQLIGLRTRRTRLLDEQKQLHKLRRREAEMQTMRDQINMVETALKYTIRDRDQLVKILENFSFFVAFFQVFKNFVQFPEGSTNCRKRKTIA